MNVSSPSAASAARSLSSEQLNALKLAMADAVAIDRRHRPTRRSVGVAKASTVRSLEKVGLLKPRGVYPEEWTATVEGRKVARARGIVQRFAGSAPVGDRARAIKLRNLCLPDVHAVGDKESHLPPRLGVWTVTDERWIEELKYGTFVRESHPRFGAYTTLVLSPKGRALVEATDAPLTVAVSDEEERALRAGSMRFCVVPDPCLAHVVNFQIESDSMNSPRDLFKRLYDPSAIFPGTKIEFVREGTGALVGTAKAGDWNRILLTLVAAYSKSNHWHFDANFEYSDRVAHDNFHRRVWAPFPEDYYNQDVRPGEHERKFARDCGFDSLREMRSVWLKRAVKQKAISGSGMRGWIKGLLVEVNAVEFAATSAMP